MWARVREPGAHWDQDETRLLGGPRRGAGVGRSDRHRLRSRARRRPGHHAGGGDPAIDLLAVTTVAGNQTLDKTTLNALRVCTVAGITGVPVAAGCAHPLVEPLEVAEDVHGVSGIDGPRFPVPTVEAVPEHAVELLRRVLTEHPEPVTLVPTAPLTNIALLLTRHPEVAGRIKEIVLMGGSTERGTGPRPPSSTSMWTRRPRTSSSAVVSR